MRVHATPLAGLFELETVTHADDRGRFTRLFCRDEFDAIRPALHFVQVNHSVTRHRGTVRGMHLQRSPRSEAKLIRCLRGRVYDVAVDLRLTSPTFGQWHAVELAADNERQMFIPEGFAHGFQALSDDAELLYQHTAPYAPEAETGVNPNDATLAIDWPLPMTTVSHRDRLLPTLIEVVSMVGA
jgi:dTDP-4-dehydrorhamnose 3,5-epimerase